LLANRAGVEPCGLLTRVRFGEPTSHSFCRTPIQLRSRLVLKTRSNCDHRVEGTVVGVTLSGNQCDGYIFAIALTRLIANYRKNAHVLMNCG
jgi:hypothetical protein